MQPAPPPNRRVSGKSYKPETDNTRKNKFCSNKTSTYSARKGVPHSVNDMNENSPTSGFPARVAE